MKRVPFLVLLLSSGIFAEEPRADGGAPLKRKGRTLAEVKLLYFHASWCSSCRRLDAGQVIERLKDREPALAAERVDVDTRGALVDRYGVTQTPTLLLVDTDGFPLGKATIDLDHPEVTVERLHKLVKKMTKGSP